MPTEQINTSPQPGTYAYFAGEWSLFMRLCEDDDMVSYEEIALALKGLVHLETWSDDAPAGDPNTKEMLMRAAFYRLERTLHIHVGVG